MYACVVVRIYIPLVRGLVGECEPRQVGGSAQLDSLAWGRRGGLGGKTTVHFKHVRIFAFFADTANPIASNAPPQTFIKYAKKSRLA